MKTKTKYTKNKNTKIYQENHQNSFWQTWWLIIKCNLHILDIKITQVNHAINVTTRWDKIGNRVTRIIIVLIDTWWLIYLWFLRILGSEFWFSEIYLIHYITFCELQIQSNFFTRSRDSTKFNRFKVNRISSIGIPGYPYDIKLHDSTNYKHSKWIYHKII